MMSVADRLVSLTSSAEPTRGFFDRVVPDTHYASHSLFAWPFFDTLLILLIGGGLGWIIATGWSRGLAFLWSSGLDPERRLAHTVAPLRLLLGLVVVITALGPLELGSSLTSAALLTGGLVLFAIVSQTWLRDVLGGVTLSVLRPFTIGDSIATSTDAGRVVDIGLTRVRVETPDGALLDLPTRILASERLRTSRGRRSLPTSLIVRLRGDIDPQRAHAELLDQVHFSAYVDAMAPVIIENLGDGSMKIEATPIHPEDSDDLRNDLAARAALIRAGHGIRGA